MPTAAPSKATLKFTLAVGLIAIPVSIYSSSEESATRRKMFVRTDDGLHPAGMTWYDKVTGDVVSKTELAGCVEMPSGDFVEVSDEELDGLLSTELNGQCKFVGFIKKAAFDENYSVERPYQIRPTPAKGSKQSPADKPFALLMKVMQRRHLIGLISYVAGGRSRYAAITGKGEMFTLRYDQEVRAPRPLPDVDLSEAEIQMANQLVDMLLLEETPIFNDEDSEKIIAFAVEKAEALAEGKEVVVPTVVTTAGTTGGDLMDLLSKSIKAAKAPGSD